MNISDKEKMFLDKRLKYVIMWPLMGTVLLCLVLGFGRYLFLFKPLFSNPFAVMSRLDSNSIPSSTLTLMAGLLPIAVLTTLFLLVVIVLFCFAAFANEKKYITLVRRMTVLVDVQSPSKPEQS